MTLAITTYERPDALAAVLATVQHLHEYPDEIVIADDGSGAATRALVEDFQAVARCPVHHVHQPHEGFRVARLRNLAVARASGDLIVFIDGDMLLHPRFIADHRRHARAGYWTQGVRVRLDAQASALCIAGRRRPNGPLERGQGLLRRCYAVHAPSAARLARRAANAFVAVKSSNQAIWRADLVAVNGFNEDFVGWGPEDKELAARLAHRGIRRQTLLFGGIAWHLHHDQAPRDRLAANRALLARTLALRLERCERGLDAHL